jgi:hypothetical protein
LGRKRAFEDSANLAANADLAVSDRAPLLVTKINEFPQGLFVYSSGVYLENHKTVFFSPSSKLTFGFQPTNASNLSIFGQRFLGSSTGNG